MTFTRYLKENAQSGDMINLWSRSNTMHKANCFQNATWDPLCDALSIPALFTQK